MATAQRQLQEEGEKVSSRKPISENEKQERQRRIEVAAEQTRKLNYSKAMNILRSAGLSKEDTSSIQNFGLYEPHFQLINF